MGLLTREKGFVNEHKLFFLILAAMVLFRLFFLFNEVPVGWDDAVYVGMAKYIFSMGESGFWEPIRPIIWPFLLGIGWALNLDILVYAKLLNILLSASTVFFIYLSCEKILGRKTALLSAAFLSFNSVFFFSNFQLLTEIPALFFTSIAVFLFLNKRFFYSGILFVIAGLSRYPFFIFLAIFGLYSLFDFVTDRSKLNQFMSYSIGAASALIPFFAFNSWMYSSMTYPLVEANRVIGLVLGCNYLYREPIYFYFLELIRESWLYLLMPLGAVLVFKKGEMRPERILFFISFLLPFIYLQTLSCKAGRYALLFLPFLIILSAYGLEWILDKMKCPCLIKEKRFILFTTLIIIYGASSSFSYFNDNTTPHERPLSYDSFDFQDKTVWISSPWHTLHSDRPFKLLYYPVYDADLSIKNYEIVKASNNTMIMMDECPMSITCRESDLACKENKEKMIDYLKENYLLEYNDTVSGCTYQAYSN